MQSCSFFIDISGSVRIGLESASNGGEIHKFKEMAAFSVSSYVDKVVWAPHPDLAWVAGKVRDADKSSVTIDAIGGDSFQISTQDALRIEIANQSSISNVYDNLVNLEEFNQGAIIHQLRNRYAKDGIYTWIGSILVSLNPYKLLPIYSTDTLMDYLECQKQGGVAAIQKRSPHIYAISGLAYRGMSMDRESQAFVISGESGAGKTECTKLILQYLSEAAGSSSGVEQEILQTNPLLEAFGNAKTLRNNNSSRFGKWMEIRFDPQGKISGAKVVNYLLEKSRVVHQGQGERNYHIFYQVCAGAMSNFKLALDDPSYFNYLNQSGCMDVPGMDDEHEYQEVLESMQKLKFTNEEINSILQIVAGVLHLGNLEFKEKGEGSVIPSKVTLDTCAKVLDLKADELQHALCFKTVSFGRDVTEIPLKPTDASDARHTLAKALFGRLFDWLIVKVNQKLCKTEDTNTIGVLDIFGFEVFDNNSFEQFCINFANEKLQHHFTQHIFLMEQNEYQAEGILVDKVSFTDNYKCINMIEGNPGIIRLLDEEIVVPKGTDLSLVEKLHKQFHPNEKNKHESYGIIKKKKTIFIIKHYAGAVEYEISGFLEKNRDTLYDSLSSAMVRSSNEVIQQLFQTKVEESVSPGTGTRKKKKGNASLGSQFKSQLDSLLFTLNAAQPHFIRCIKPNLLKVPQNFNSDLVLGQLKYAGLFEAIRIRATGFSYRKSHQNFYSLYEVCLPRTLRAEVDRLVEPERSQKGCELLISQLQGDLDSNDIKLGKSKVFYRSSQLSILDRKRDMAIEQTVIDLQSRVRGYLARKLYAAMQVAYKKCISALENRHREALLKCLEYVDAQKFVFPILIKMRKALDYLNEEARIVQLLRDAIAEKDFFKLDGAMIQVDTYELISKTKDPNVISVIQEAETAIELFRESFQAKSALKSAASATDIEALKKAISDAREAQVEREFIEQAESILNELLRQEQVMDKLAQALLTKSIDELEKNLKESETVELSNIDRKRLVSDCENALLVHYDGQISSAIESLDEESFNLHLKQIKQSFIWPKSTDIILKAKDFMAKLEAKRGAGSTLPSSQDIELPIESKVKAHEHSEMAVESVQSLDDLPPPPVVDMADLPPPPIHDEDLLFEEPPPIPDDLDVFTSKMSLPDSSREHKHVGMAFKSLTNEEEEARIVLELRKAIYHLDKDLMEKYLIQAQKLNISEGKEIVQASELCYGMSDLQFLDFKLGKAYQAKHIVKMKNLLAQAEKAGIVSMNYNLARQYLTQKFEESKDRVTTSGVIRDYSNNIQYYKNLHSIISFNKLRSPEDFCKKNIFSKKKPDESMYMFSPQPISKSMIDFSFSYTQSKTKTKYCKGQALSIFNDILYWMKLKYHNYPQTLGPTIMQKAVEEPLLRDEVFCQLIKQTTGNHVVQSLVYALKLLYLCLLCFRPTHKELNEILKSHLASLCNVYISKFTTFDVAEDLAIRCFELLSRPLNSGGVVPPQEVVTAFYELSSEKIIIVVPHDNDPDKVGDRLVKNAQGKENYDEFMSRISIVPQKLVDFFNIQDINPTASELSTYAALKLKLPYIGRLRLDNAPSQISLDDHNYVDENQSLTEIIEILKAAHKLKKTEWFLVSTDGDLDQFDPSKELPDIPAEYLIKDDNLVDEAPLYEMQDPSPAFSQPAVKKKYKKPKKTVRIQEPVDDALAAFDALAGDENRRDDESSSGDDQDFVPKAIPRSSSRGSFRPSLRSLVEKTPDDVNASVDRKRHLDQLQIIKAQLEEEEQERRAEEERRKIEEIEKKQREIERKREAIAKANEEAKKKLEQISRIKERTAALRERNSSIASEIASSQNLQSKLISSKDSAEADEESKNSSLTELSQLQMSNASLGGTIGRIKRKIRPTE